jgi:hypothetical protein
MTLLSFTIGPFYRRSSSHIGRYPYACCTGVTGVQFNLSQQSSTTARSILDSRLLFDFLFLLRFFIPARAASEILNVLFPSTKNEEYQKQFENPLENNLQISFKIQNPHKKKPVNKCTLQLHRGLPVAVSFSFSAAR